LGPIDRATLSPDTGNNTSRVYKARTIYNVRNLFIVWNSKILENTMFQKLDVEPIDLINCRYKNTVALVELTGAIHKYTMV
jgi:hypothetical protein